MGHYKEYIVQVEHDSKSRPLRTRCTNKKTAIEVARKKYKILGNSARIKVIEENCYN